MTEQIDLKRRPAGGKCDGAAVTDHPRKKDADLVVRLIGGSTDAWQEFIDNFSSAIFGAVINTLRKSGYNSDDSHDISQDVYLRLCKNDFRLLRQFDSTRAAVCAPAAVRCWFRMRRFCMSPVRRHNGSSAASVHVIEASLASGRVSATRS